MSSSELQSLYQEIILDHSRTPIGFGLPDGEADGSSHQLNPTCGDEITLQVRLGPDGVVDVRWDGHGCAISQASASLFCELAEGKTGPDLLERIEHFRTALRSRGTIETDEDVLGDAAVLGSVSRYIARVKCAMLGWVAAEDAIRQSLSKG